MILNPLNNKAVIEKIHNEVTPWKKGHLQNWSLTIEMSFPFPLFEFTARI